MFLYFVLAVWSPPQEVTIRTLGFLGTLADMKKEDSSIAQKKNFENLGNFVNTKSLNVNSS